MAFEKILSVFYSGGTPFHSKVLKRLFTKRAYSFFTYLRMRWFMGFGSKPSMFFCMKRNTWS